MTEIGTGKPTVSRLLVATLDILGVTKIMLNIKQAELLDLSRTFNDTFQRVSVTLKEALHTEAKSNNPSDILFHKASNNATDNIKVDMFADTIVFSYDLNKSYPELSGYYLDAMYNVVISSFLLLVQHVTFDLFTQGFPARGCIDIGWGIHGQRFFIGRPFANAIKQANQIEFSGLIMTSEVYTMLDKLNTYMGNQSNPVDYVPLNVQTKSGIEKLICINWIPPSNTSLRRLIAPCKLSFSNYILTLFMMHGKSLSPSAILKYKNTLEMLHIFIMRNKKRAAKHNKPLVSPTK